MLTTWVPLIALLVALLGIAVRARAISFANGRRIRLGWNQFAQALAEERCRMMEKFEVLELMFYAVFLAGAGLIAYLYVQRFIQSWWS
jgi:hypothetical protein